MEFFGIKLKSTCKDAALVKEWQRVQSMIKVDQFKTEHEARRFITFMSARLQNQVEIYPYTRNTP